MNCSQSIAVVRSMVKYKGSSSLVCPAVFKRLKDETVNATLIELENLLGPDILSLKRRFRFPELPENLKVKLKHGSADFSASVAECDVADLIYQLPGDIGNYVIVKGWLLKTKNVDVTDVDVFVIHPQRGVILVEVSMQEEMIETKLKKDQTMKALNWIKAETLKHLTESNEELDHVQKIFGSFQRYVCLTKCKRMACSTNGFTAATILWTEDCNQNVFRDKVHFGELQGQELRFYTHKVYPYLLARCYQSVTFVDAKNFLPADSLYQVVSEAGLMLEAKSEEVNVVRSSADQISDVRAPNETRARVAKVRRGLYLSPEQCGILSLDSRLLFITGAAGTGKTFLLYEKMRRKLADGETCLFLCRNQLLAETTVAVFANVNVLVYTFNQFITEFMKSIQTWETDETSVSPSIASCIDPLNLFGEEKYTEEQLKVVDRWRSYNLFVDEFQDAKRLGRRIEHVWLNVPYEDKIRWLAYDNNQQSISLAHLKINPEEYEACKVMLNGIYRSPLDHFRLLKSLYRPHAEDRHEPSMAHGIKTGMKPKIILYSGEDEQTIRNLILRELILLLKEKCEESAIILLHNGRDDEMHSFRFKIEAESDFVIIDPALPKEGLETNDRTISYHHWSDYTGCQTDIAVFAVCPSRKDGDQTKAQSVYTALTRSFVHFVGIFPQKEYEHIVINTELDSDSCANGCKISFEQ